MSICRLICPRLVIGGCVLQLAKPSSRRSRCRHVPCGMPFGMCLWLAASPPPPRRARVAFAHDPCIFQSNAKESLRGPRVLQQAACLTKWWDALLAMRAEKATIAPVHVSSLFRRPRPLARKRKHESVSLDCWSECGFFLEEKQRSGSQFSRHALSSTNQSSSALRSGHYFSSFL